MGTHRFAIYFSLLAVLLGSIAIGVALTHALSQVTPATPASPVNAFLAQVAQSQAFPTPSEPTAPYTGNTYVEVHDSCGPYFGGTCVNMRSAPTTTAPSVLRVRNGVVLQVSPETVTDSTGRTWYRVVFDEWLRYPERAEGGHYIAANYARLLTDPGIESYSASATSTVGAKRIVIDRSKQMLYAYDGDTLYLATPVSTGLDLTPTPRGTFHVYRKTPSRYMQGPLPGISDQYYDLPGVPWNLYFTLDGGAIHGTYWHDHFGQEWSHGCVNLPVDTARTLYEWTPLGTPVYVRG